MSKSSKKRNNFQGRPGFVLLVTLGLLVVLAMLGYTLSTRVASQRHRDKYIIDYSSARYGCDSAVKYALATLEEIDPQLISRPNEPDFSDLFYLTPVEYQKLLEQWGLGSELTMFDGKKRSRGKAGIGEFDEFGNIDNFNNVDFNEMEMDDFESYGSVEISGPYGPAWPFVTEPVEFEIGSAKVRIEVEDENAKYPLGWAMLDDADIKREAEAGFESFCEMTGLTAEQIDLLKLELQEIGKIRPFALDFQPITRTVKTAVTTRTTSVTSRSTSKAPPMRVSRKTVAVPDQISEQTTHFAKLFHSSLIDTEALARPIITGPDKRNESAMKYMGLWGTMKVNINTAPRHVLEAAFIFGGNQVEIAEEIIQRRRIEPFSDFQALKTDLFRYSDSIDKCEKYITTVSRFFTIKVTAVSGVAKASSVIAITKDGEKVKRIAVING
ncbi:MAG: general secretion pathway protein GspK [Planctomycetes bacterium]|nr:general secretion pathway protein GspK [Planctomycetota bacterium]MBL7145724.1 general secretion pathway protein GspK [Phycisphaerae bacterium]